MLSSRTIICNQHNVLHINDSAADNPGTIRNRVLGGARFAIYQLNNHFALSMFDEDSELRRRKSHCAPTACLPFIAREINRLNDPEARARFTALATFRDCADQPLRWNIAYRKPALQS